MRICFLILLFFTLSRTVQGQDQYIDKDYECKLLDCNYRYMKNPTKLDTLLIAVECLVIRDQFSQGMRKLDSLIQVYPENGKLYYYKAFYCRDNNIYDTTYFSLLRKSIDLNYQNGSSLGTFANFCYEFIVACEKPNSLTILPKTKKKELLNVTENYCLKAIQLDNAGKNSHLELLAMTKQKRNEISGIKTGDLKFSNDFDTLIFVSQLNDCGEFGGHLEYIKFYHIEKNIVGEFSQDVPYCQDEMQPDTPPYAAYKKGPEKVDSTSIKSYIKHLKNINKRPDAVTNAPTSFWVIQGENIYFVRDWTGNSKQYETLRDKIFK